MKALWGLCALVGVQVCAGSAVEAATVHFEGGFTSQTTYCNGAVGCSDGAQSIDVAFGRSFEAYFDASGSVTFLSQGLPDSSIIHLGYEYMRDYRAPVSLDYEHELLVPAFGPNGVSAETFAAGDVHRYLEADWQSTARQVVEEPDGSLSHPSIGWSVGASQQWDVMNFDGSGQQSWGQLLNFSMIAPQLLTLPDVQRPWLAGEFLSMVSGAYLQNATFAMHADIWSRDDAIGAYPTVSIDGWAHITAVDGIPAVPEPASYGLMLAGLAGLAARARRH